MNNGRDCPHGRQVGKCDTCDLIKTELELQRVTAERDAAIAQNKRMKTFIRMTAEKFEGDHHVEPSMLTLMRVTKEVPDDVLSAHDAEVAKKAVQAALRMYGSTDLSNKEIIALSENYAASLNK